jgi:hypothetical protein
MFLFYCFVIKLALALLMLPLRATWRNGSALDFDFSFQQDKTSRGCRFESCSGRFPMGWFHLYFVFAIFVGGVKPEGWCWVLAHEWTLEKIFSY